MGGESSFGGVRRAFVLAIAALLALLLVVPAESGIASPASWMFDNDRVVEIDLGDVSPAEIEALEAEPDEYVSASFRLAVDGVTQGSALPEVGLRLKGGTGSFREIGRKSGFKVKFDEYVKGQRYFALERLTLNNMVQDASMQHEALTYELVQEMGLKGPRTGYAFVRLNGEVYGVYANVETMDEHWLPEHFTSTEHLYEADAAGTDVEPEDLELFEVDEGDDEDLSDLEALIAAANDDDGDWSDGMAAVADLAQMTRLWAVERYVSHWDGYAGEAGAFRPNNYYLHSDATGLFTMLPWGTDQTWGSAALDAWVDFDEDAGGILFNRCKADASCWALYEDALADLYELVTQGGVEFGRKAVERAELLETCQALEVEGRREYSSAAIAEGVDELLEYIDLRPQELADYLGLEFAGVSEAEPGSPAPGCAPDDKPPARPPGTVDSPPPPAAATPAVRFGPTGWRDGRVATRAALTGPGRLVQLATARLDGRSRRVCADRARLGAAGTATLRCRPSRWAREHLRDQSLRIRVRLVFFPSGGERTVRVRALTLPRAR